MVYLFLSEPNWNHDVDDYDSAKMRVSLLSKLESVLWSLMMSEGRLQARLWLCKTIAGMSSISARDQRELFVSLLRSKTQNSGLASQLLLMMFEKRPDKGGSILAKRSYILEKFFDGNPGHILHWFSNFSSGSSLEQGKGAKALCQFAFKHRDTCWEELEWKGKHGQSPAVVATKPHYFLDLDIQHTVENFLENVPEFWLSNEFAESVRDGEIISIDSKFFIQYFVDLMYKDDAKDVWDVINEFLVEQPFSSLCQHLLIALEEKDFCYFVELLCEILNPRMEPEDFMNGSYLFEVVLTKCSDFESIDQLLLLNAVLTQGRQLLLLLRDEDAQEERAKINDIVSQICAIPINTNSLNPIFKNCFKMKIIEVMKCLGLQCWVFYFRLSQECQTPASWEALFADNKIGFRKSDKYALLDHDGSSEENCSDTNLKFSVKHRRRNKGRKKRRRRSDPDAIFNNELLGFDPTITNHRLDLQSGSGSWLLLTDGYSASWSSADLPEHLYRYCLSKWMDWFLVKCC